MYRLFYLPWRWWALGHMSYGVTDLHAEDLLDSKQYVIVSNHQTNIDPFIILPLMGWKVLGRLGSIRLFAHTVLFNFWLRRWAMLAFGAFPAREHPTLPYGLSYAQDQLKAGGRTVMIFPEGRMSKPRETEPKPGVSVMAGWPKVMILPVHIEWEHVGRVFGGKLRVHVGAPFSGKGMSATEIMDRVYDLAV
jgi:1-acyl-sn-glycerol-3-phosphate acyltransferase